MATAIQTRDESLANIEKVMDLDKMALALRGTRIAAPRMKQLMMNALRQNSALIKCTPASLWTAVMEACTFGWEIGGPVAQAYLVPYGDKATLVPGYRGLMDLARRSGEIKVIAHGTVHEGDRFIPPEDPLEPVLIHQESNEPGRKSRPITHVWAGYSMTNGSRVYVIMSREDIDDHKERYAKGWKSDDSAWSTAWESMALKTVLKKPIMDGRVPIASEHQRIIQRGDDSTGTWAADIPPIASDTLGHDTAILSSLPSGEIDKDEEWRLFSNEASERMEKAETLGRVDEVVGELNSEYVGDAQAKMIFELAETRRSAIKA